MKHILLIACVGLWSQVFALPFDLGEDFDSSEDNSSEHGLGSSGRATNCSCGYTNKARIVGGKETGINEFPMVAGVLRMDTMTLFCGSTLITKRHALTAAHCTRPVIGRIDIGILIGDHDITSIDDTEAAEVHEVSRIIEHPDYNEHTMKNDISLLEVSEDITWTQEVGPACLPSQPLSLDNQVVKVLGWGKTKYRGAVSQTLQKVNLRLIPVAKCAASFPKKDIDSNPTTQICSYRKEKDSCQGDSGGPVIWLDPDVNRYTLVGVVSYGKGCGTANPAVNTDVSRYLDWIQANIQATNQQTCAKV